MLTFKGSLKVYGTEMIEEKRVQMCFLIKYKVFPATNNTEVFRTKHGKSSININSKIFSLELKGRQCNHIFTTKYNFVLAPAVSEIHANTMCYAGHTLVEFFFGDFLFRYIG